MKQVRLFCAVLALAAVGGWAVTNACEKDKTSQASVASYSKTAHAAGGQCTAAQMAACKAAGTSASAASTSGSCSAHGVKASMAAAGGECPYHSGASAATAASMDHCAGKASATTAAMTAADHCAGKTSAATAAAGHSCAAGKTAAVTAGNAHVCGGEGMATAAVMSNHADCDACMDMTGCAEEINKIGASSQMVPLKNGVMFVYTADSPSKVHAVQAALARRSARMASMTTAGDQAHLCSDCKAMRGAAASGKLTREVVNIEDGCLTMMTSNDPRIVSKIHAMTGTQLASRVK
jgi:hypothetical protein